MPTSEDEAELRFRAEVDRNLRRNYLASLGHGLFGQTGMRLLNAPTLVPAYIHSLAGFDAAVGIARGLQYFGMVLSPLLGATMAEHRRRVLSLNFVNGGLMRIQILGLALGGFWLPDPWRLFAAWASLGLFGFFLGIQGVVFNVLVAKVIPVRRRGILMGARTALSGVTATAVAIFAGREILDTNAFGNGYATLFVIAFALTSGGLALLLFVREPDAPRVREAAGLQQRLRELPELLRSDRAFTLYFSARALATMGRMAMPFYVLYAATQLELTGARVGYLTGAFVLSQSVVNVFWGLLADRRGFRFVFLWALSLWMASAVLLMTTAGFGSLLAAFAGLGAGMGGFQMSAQNLVLEFGSRHNLPMRIAVANSASEGVAAFGAVAGGLLIAVVSYVGVFCIAIACQLAAMAIVLFHVDEPRRRAAPPN